MFVCLIFICFWEEFFFFSPTLVQSLISVCLLTSKSGECDTRKQNRKLGEYKQALWNPWQLIEGNGFTKLPKIAGDSRLHLNLLYSYKVPWTLCATHKILFPFLMYEIIRDVYVHLFHCSPEKTINVCTGSSWPSIQ